VGLPDSASRGPGLSAGQTKGRAHDLITVPHAKAAQRHARQEAAGAIGPHRDGEFAALRRSFIFGRDLLSLFASLRETDGDGLFSTLDRPASPA